MWNPFERYYRWMIRSATRLPGSDSQIVTVLWLHPLLLLAVPAFLLSQPGRPVVLTDWRTINLAPDALACWLLVLGSIAWTGYSIFALVRDTFRGWFGGFPPEGPPED